mmetsp:Transcript_49128/g.87338  ORF Transcript_49128/g.87338 Transcript_49128/m.87338 type:complete len:197 (-) Transcript_49128:299-889(-)
MAFARPTLCMVCLNLTVLMAASNSDCSDASCMEGVETSAFVQSRLEKKSKGAAAAAVVQKKKAAEKSKSEPWIVKLARSCNGPCRLSTAQQSKAALVQKAKQEPELEERDYWIIKFADSCTDEALAAFCSGEYLEDIKCHQPVIKPSEYGFAYVILEATEGELDELKEEDHLCKIAEEVKGSKVTADEPAEEEEEK